MSERKVEVKETVDRLARALANGIIKPVIGPQGAIAFPGWLEQDRRNVTDSCAYRLMATSSPLAMQAIARAEALAGRTVNKQAVAVGAHSHDGGRSWHDHRG